MAADELASNSWLCRCGYWETSGLHCRLCGEEPPWGCDCGCHDDRDYDDLDRDTCERCGGDGSIEYMDAGPSVWGEDCPSEVNHLVECPDCGGTGSAE